MYSPNELLALYEEKFSTYNFNESPTSLYEPVNHIMNIKGKRIRPLLVLMSCDMFGGNVPEALNPSFAMEVFHNFTLVHDDIMDRADLRRGQPTVHKLYGLNAGILAGDVMLAYAYKYLSQLPAAFIPAAFEVFNKTAIEIFEGQQMDIDFETRDDVTEDAYLKMIEYKTSVLVACCLQIGAIVAGADKKNQQLIYDFGLHLGLAFQIKDDYLDTFGEADKVGKRIGGDILQNKKTYLQITALDIASEEQKKQLLVLMSETKEDIKIAETKLLFEKLGVRALTEKKINDLFNHAITSLQAVEVTDQNREALLTFAQKIHQREY